MGVIFISHSSKNNDEAIAVRDWLRDEGYAETFLDLDPEHGFAPGQRWQEELRKAGERCSAIVFVVTPDWVASEWCQTEFLVAVQLGKKIFPIMVAPTPFDTLRLEMRAHFQIADASTPETRADGFERLRIGLRKAGLDPKHFPWPPADDPDRSPYRGLQALAEQDAAVFLGRDAQITAGLDKLRQMRDGSPRRILTIAAASGAGKSSFLKAGLLARLERDTENFLVLPTMRPGGDALSGDAGLLNALSLTDAATSDDTLAAHLDGLQANVVAHLEGLATAAGERYERPAPTLVLPIDQAEELFSADNATGSDTIGLLARCLALKPDFTAVATIRSDSLGGLQADSRIAASLDMFNLPAMPPANFKDVIEGPGQIAKPPITVEPALTQRLVEDLNDADALPLLAFTMERLVAEYGDDHLVELHEYTDGLGGCAGAINSAVETAFAKCEQDAGLPVSRLELDALARSAFIPWLVQLDEVDASPKRRVAKLADLPDASHRLISHFVEERLLVASNKSAEQVIEVSHEAVLRRWRGLAAWIGEERVTLQRLQEVQRAALHWRGDARSRSQDMLIHRGERLQHAEALLMRSDMERALAGTPAAYLKACREAEDAAEAHERKQQSRQRSLQRWVGFVTFAAFAITLAGASFVTKGQRDLSQSESVVMARLAKIPYQADDFVRSTRLSALAVRPTGFAQPAPEAFDAFASLAQASRQQIQLSHIGSVEGAAFSKDETRILTWSADNTARLWDAQTGAQIGPSLQHEGAVWGAAFSKDETRILTWSRDNTARLWDAQTGAQIGPSLQHEDIVRGAAFSKDETHIFTWSWDNTASLWDVEFAVRKPNDATYLADLCARKLKGAPIDTGEINTATGEPIFKSPRHIDKRDVEIAPILRGREGEDVCDWSPPWYQAITRPLADWVFD